MTRTRLKYKRLSRKADSNINNNTIRNGITKRKNKWKTLTYYTNSEHISQEGGFLGFGSSFSSKYSKFMKTVAELNKLEVELNKEIDSIKGQAKTFEGSATDTAQIESNYIQTHRQLIVLEYFQMDQAELPEDSRIKAAEVEKNLKMLENRKAALLKKLDENKRSIRSEIPQYIKLKKRFLLKQTAFNKINEKYAKQSGFYQEIKNKQQKYTDIKSTGGKAITSHDRKKIKEYEANKRRYEQVIKFGDEFINTKNKILNEINTYLQQAENYKKQFGMYKGEAKDIKEDDEGELLTALESKMDKIEEWQKKYGEFAKYIFKVNKKAEDLKNDVQKLMQCMEIVIANVNSIFKKPGEEIAKKYDNRVVIRMKREIEFVFKDIMPAVEVHLKELKGSFYAQTPAARISIDYNQITSILNLGFARLEVLKKMIDNVVVENQKGGSRSQGQIQGRGQSRGQSQGRGPSRGQSQGRPSQTRSQGPKKVKSTMNAITQTIRDYEGKKTTLEQKITRLEQDTANLSTQLQQKQTVLQGSATNNARRITQDEINSLEINIQQKQTELATDKAELANAEKEIATGKSILLDVQARQATQTGTTTPGTTTTGTTTPGTTTPGTTTPVPRPTGTTTLTPGTTTPGTTTPGAPAPNPAPPQQQPLSYQQIKERANTLNTYVNTFDYPDQTQFNFIELNENLRNLMNNLNQSKFDELLEENKNKLREVVQLIDKKKQAHKVSGEDLDETDKGKIADKLTSITKTIMESIHMKPQKSTTRDTTTNTADLDNTDKAAVQLYQLKKGQQQPQKDKQDKQDKDGEKKWELADGKDPEPKKDKQFMQIADLIKDIDQKIFPIQHGEVITQIQNMKKLFANIFSEGETGFKDLTKLIQSMTNKLYEIKAIEPDIQKIEAKEDSSIKVQIDWVVKPNQDELKDLYKHTSTEKLQKLYDQYEKEFPVLATTGKLDSSGISGIINALRSAGKDKIISQILGKYKKQLDQMSNFTALIEMVPTVIVGTEEHNDKERCMIYNALNTIYGSDTDKKAKLDGLPAIWDTKNHNCMHQERRDGQGRGGRKGGRGGRGPPN